MTGPTRQSGRASSGRLSRRRLLAAVGVAAAGAATPVEGATQEQPVWPLFQYDRWNTGDGRNTRGPQGAAGARWGYVDGEAFETTPVVTDATVFAADEGANQVVAVDRASGRERWRVETTLDTARLAYHEGTVFVPAEEVEARSATDGSLQWSVDVVNPYGVAVMGDFLFVAAGGGTYRISLGSKDVDWHNDRVRQLAPSLAVSEDLVYAIGTQYGQAIALDPPSGSRRWLRRVEGAGTGAPTLRHKLVYLPTDAALTVVSRESGVPQWTFDEGIGSSVAVTDSTVFAATTDGEIVALDAMDGTELWRASPVNGANPPVLAGGVLYATGTDGTIAALNPGDGSVVWSKTVGGARVANVAAGGGELYVADRNGQLAALAQGASGGLTESTPTATEPPTEAPDDGTPAGGDDGAASPTSTGGPGFGVAAGAAALGGGALAARRWLQSDEEAGDRDE